MQEKVSTLASLLESSSKMVLVTHTHPDGDALGSQAALWHYLRANYPKAGVRAVHESAPDNLDFLCNGVPFLEPAHAEKAIAEADLLVCTDINAFSRCGDAEPFLVGAKAKKVLIDHHLGPDDSQFDLVFSRTDVSSACELAYNILKELGAPLPLACRNALMAGMTTDTNNFANSVFPGTFRMASELIASGVDRDGILELLYNRCRENSVRAIAWILGNLLTIRPDGLAYIVISNEVWHRFGLRSGELEGLVNIPLRIGKVKVCVRMQQNPDNLSEFRASIRSKRGFSANALAVRYFHGGGHELASGGKLTIPEDISGESDLRDYLEKIELL